MNKYTFTDKHGLTWERVNRTAARRAYRAGDLVQLWPCNLRPDSMWRPVAIIHNDYDAILMTYSCFDLLSLSDAYYKKI
jgi:hypothetical protein